MRANTFDFLQQRQPTIVKAVPKQESLCLSLDDIYHLADRERLSYSARTRREAVELAQNSTHKFDEVVGSRPHTSASRYIHEVRRDVLTPKSLRSEPVPSRVNSRLGPSEYDDDDEESIFPMNYLSSLPVGREICEIIGPQVCSQCRQDQTRQLRRSGCDQCFSTLHVSHENMTTAAVLQRHLPGLSEQDIQDKIAKGEIAKPKILRKRQTIKCNRDIKAVTTIDKSNGSNTDIKHTPRNPSMFFVNIRDLNAKITSGQFHRTVGFSEKVQQQVLKKQEELRKRNAEKKKLEPEPEPQPEKKDRKTKFDPDILLSVAQQTNEPAFFAGRKQDYVLPERLPDPVRFADVKNLKQDNSNNGFQLYGLEEEAEEDEEVANLMS